MKQTILGSNGYIGAALKDYLILNGYEVLTPSIEEVCTSKNNWGVIYYCIGLTADFRKKPFATIESHVTFNSLIYLSSTRVYQESIGSTEETQLSIHTGNPSNLYNLSKLTGESICLNAGRTNVKVARVSNVVGKSFNRDTLIGELILQAKSGAVNLNSNIESAKDYISIYDVVEVLTKIANIGRLRLYNVASGKNLTTKEILTEMRKYYNFDLVYDTLATPQINPNINIELITREFNFESRSSLKEIGKLLQLLKENTVNFSE